MLALAYPVCNRHASGLPLANALTRNTLGAKLLRGMLYLLGPLSIIAIAPLPLVYLLSIAKPTSRPTTGLSATGFFLFSALGAAFVLVIWSFKKLPIRITKHSSEKIGLAFSNPRYAEEFARLNKSLIN